MAFGRSNNSVEVPVTLGLQEAQRQIAELRKQLNDGVKVGSGGFDFITKVLDKAQNQADKLGGKLGEAFKTSNSAKSFMREYQSMIEMLSTAKAKMGNLGFEEIKFSVKDQEVIDNAVKQIQTLSTTLENIKSGKAIELINSSSVEGVENLRTQIGNLIKDTSGLTFDGLNKTLQGAANEAGAKVTDLTNKIKTLESTINTISADGLSSVQAAVNSTSQNNSIGKSLVNVQDINEANERLRQFANTLSDIPGRLKSFTVGRNENVAKFVEEQTDKIEKEYQRQITVVKDNRDKVQSILTAINNTGARYNSSGKKTTTAWTNEQKEALLNSAEMQAAVQATNLNLKKIFEGLDEADVSGRFKRIKAALEAEAQSLGIKEENLTNLRDSFKSNFSAIFDDLGETVVLKQRDVQNKLKEALSGFNIDPSVLKEFGFDINNIRNGQDLANVYDQLKSSLDAYVQSLEAQKQSLSSGELENAKRAQEELNNAIATAAKVQEESGSSAEGLQKQIDSLRKTIEDLVNKYNQLTGKKITFNTDEINKGKSAIDGAITSLDNLNKKQQALSNVQSAVTRWMGFYQVLNLTKRAVKEMVSHITELDTVMTQIAVVTNMSQDDLWGQIGQYSEIARQYGVAIKGVYEVSQIYYQQGLNKGDVMNLTTETLKMARIAGIDYATAADYMTTAIRGFKLEMTEAAHVTDVFSNLAAHTASDTEELATAISKTASSAEAVGASFEATSAMIATMVSVTRESATNIGTALKSVISRYGEMTSDPTKLVDSEGEEMSLNRVDKALRTIGITIQDTNGQFRDFDDVILELGDKWDSLDKNAQRYIATIMAGNRQQSRFLALVGNVDEYRRALELANNSEDTGELQTLKTLDSIDAKMERMKVTIQEFYTSSGIQDLYKRILDTITNTISGANELPKIFGNFPATALALGMQVVTAIKNVAQILIAIVQNNIAQIRTSVNQGLREISVDGATQGRIFGSNWYQAAKAEMEKIRNEQNTSKINAWSQTSAGRAIGTFASAGLSLLGAGLSIGSTSRYGASKSVDTDTAAGWEMGGAGLLSGLSGAISGFLTAGPWGAVAGALLSGIPSITSAIQMINVSLSRRLELAQKAETEAKQQATIDQGEVKDLQQAYDKLKDLSSKQYESAEAMTEYHEYMNQLADSYPALVSAMEVNGDQIVTLESLELALAEARSKAAASTVEALRKEKDRLGVEQTAWNQLQDTDQITLTKDIISGLSSEEILFKLEGGVFDHAVLDSEAYKNLGYGGHSYIGSGGRSPEEELVRAYDMAITYLGYEGERLIQPSGSNDIDDYKRIYEENQEKINAVLNDWILNNVTETSQIIPLYVDWLKKAVDNNKDLNYEQLTGIRGINADNLTQTLESLKPGELLDKIQHTRDFISDNVEKTQRDIEILDKSITAGSASSLVQDQLAINSKSVSGIDLNKYSQFISSMISRYGNYDWTESGNTAFGTTLYNELVKYIDEHQSLADDLIQNLNYSQISSIDKLNEFLSNHKFTTDDGINQNIISSIKADYQKSIESTRDNLNNAIKTYIGNFSTEEGMALWRLFDQFRTEDNITAEIATVLQTALPTYDKLKTQGYTVAAENYLDGLITLYQGIGEMDDEQQHKILPTLKELDLTDTASIDSAIESFTNLGLTDLVNTLTDIKARVAQDIGITIERIIAEASQSVESVEKVLDNIGKGMSESDALEKAQEIINSSENKDRSALDLIKFDEDIGQWMLTPEAIKEAYDQIVTNSNQEVTDITAILEKFNSQLGAQISNYFWLGQSDLSETDLNNTLNGLKTDAISLGLTEQQADKFIQQVESWRTAYLNNNGGLSWKDYIDKQLKSYKELQDVELETLQTLIDNAPLQYLSKVNWESIAGGTATEADQEFLRIILQMINVEDATIQSIMDEVAQANYTLLESTLAGLGINFKVGNTTKAKSQAANIQKYINTIDQLDQLEVGSTVTKGQIDILKNAGFDVNEDGVIRAVGDLISAYKSVYDQMISTGKATTSELNNAAAKVLNAPYLKQQQGVEALNKGINMSWDDLMQMYTDAGKTFGKQSVEQNGSERSIINDIEDAKKDLLDKGLISVNDIGQVTIEDAYGLAAELGWNIASAQFKAAYDSFVESRAEEKDKISSGRILASRLQTLSSMKANSHFGATAIRDTLLTDISDELKGKFEVLGIDVKSDMWEITSEWQRDQLVQLLTQIAETYEGQDKEVVDAMIASLKEASDTSTEKQYSSTSNLITKEVSMESAKAFMKAFGQQADTEEQIKNYMTETLKYKYNSWTDTFEADINTLNEINQRIAKLKEDKSEDHSDELNILEQKAKQLEYDITKGTAQNAILTALQNYSNLSYEAFAELENATRVQLDAAVRDIGGSYHVNVNQLMNLLRAAGIAFDDAILEQYAQITDSYSSNIQNAVSLLSQGTTSLADMQNFADSYKAIVKEDVSVNDLFDYQSLQGAFTLNNEYLNKYIQANAEKLGLVGQELTQYVNDMTTKVLAQNIDIDSFLEADNIDGQAANQLKSALSDLRTSMQIQLKDSTTNYIHEARAEYDVLKSEGKIAKGTTKASWARERAREMAEEAAKQNNENWSVILEKSDDQILQALANGGDDAVKIASAIAKLYGKELSAEEMQKYYAPLAEKYSSMASKLAELTVGQYVTGDLRDELAAVGAVDSKGVVTTVQKMAEVYQNIYKEMKDAAGVTKAQLNSVYASYLTAGEQSEIDAISALGDAMGMTYDSLGAMLANYGKNLEDFAKNWMSYGIEQIGNGKIRINDFEVFAANVGLTDTTSEEYISAFKTYNDSLIALDRSTQQNILDELTAITEAKPGSRINLTTIASKLHESLVNAVIGDLGGYIQNGILTLGEDANVAGIIDNIVRLVQHTNDETIMLAQNELDTLADTLAGLIGNINSLISSGISGSLTNSQVSELRKWATDNGLKNIDFVSTAEGFQLTEDAAFELYGALNDVSALSASKLLPTIQGMNKQYNTLEGTMKAYEEAVEGSAKKIALAAMITQKQEEPESFKFMQNSMPESWQSIFNYASDYYTATQTIKTSSKTGTMDMESFYNIMAEIEGYNAGTTISGKSISEWMSSIGNFFTTDKSGNPVFDLSKAKLSLKELQTALNEAVAARSKIMSEYNATKLTLAQGAESFDFNDLLGIDGTLDMSKVTELLGASEQFAAAMDQITLNINGVQGSLKDLLTNNPELVSTDLLTSILQNYGNIDWESTDLTTAIQQLLGEQGKDTTVEVEANGEIKIAYTYRNDQIVPTYKIGDHILGEGNEIDPEELTKAYGEFISAKNMEGATIVDNTDSATIDFTLAGREVDFNIEYATGKTLYEITLSDGTVLTAPSMEGIKQAIAYANIVDPITDETIESSAKDHATFTINKGGISIDVKLENGQIQSANGIIDSQEKAQLLNELQGQLDKSLEDTPIQTTVTSLEVALSEGASITMAKTNEDGSITVELTDAATGEVKTFTIGAIEQALLSDSAKTAIQNAVDTYTAEVKSKLNLNGAKSDLEKWNPTKTIKTDLKFGLSGVNLAKGNVALATGNQALAGGTRSTLMGELGPELWVSGGHYYIAGRSGAEFVDLPNDAIVFNHLQTRKLLGTGSSGRGKPITSEQTAVAMAHGNLSGGPARETGWWESIITAVTDAWNTLWGTGTKKSSGSTSGSTAPTGLTDDQKSKLSTLLSDALSKGFENLDWSDYEDELGSMMDEIKNTARINYRTFIDTYASQCDKTTSEINELYFQAWQKDLEDSMDSEDIVSAAEGLNFYANGSIGGSSSDWQSIIGDRALITDLVKKGIMSYDAATKQYFVTNAEALANAGVDISQIEGIQEMMYDSLRSQYDQIVDYIGNGLEGSLTAMDSKSLQSLVERMGITDLQLDFEQTVNGLKLSQASAISLYNELKKVDSIAAQLTFNELVENLQESNDNYKTMTSLLSHIEDLSLKIQDANSYSDERIKQYTEELALAKEIAAVRATSADESMSWYDESIPAGMQNVLDYRQSWADAIDMMRDAQETGVFDFTGFINTAKQINSQAQTLGQTLNFCGYELNGTSEAIDAFITAAANSLGAVTNDNGTNFGVVLEKFGADLTDGAASYENSATSAMQTFAKSQIQILDGLIQMFEMIVAMESFKDVDEDDNGLLDWKELFNLDELEENSTEFAQYIKTEFKTAAQQILDNAGSNEDLQKALTSVKVNGNTMQELLEYATGAIDKLTYSMTAGDYQKAMSVFYNLLASGDYDLDNIAASLKEALATSGSDFKGTIEYGNFVLDMKYGVTISKTSTGTYKSKSGQEYPTAAEACKATVLEEAGLENDQIVWSEDKEVASGTVTYKSFSVEIIADAEGARYNYNGVAYNSLEDATMAAWNAAGGEQGTQLTFDEWKIQQGITIVTTVSEVDTSNISKSQIDKLVGTSWQEIKSKWNAATTDEAKEEFQIEYGFTLDNETTEADFNEMKERLGITENRMELTLAITNLDEIAAEFASKMTNITLNPTSVDATGSATVTADTTEAVTSIGAVEEAINKAIKAIEYLNTLKVAIDKGTAEADMQAIEKATKDAETAVGSLNSAVSSLTAQFGGLNSTLNTLQGYLSSLSNSTISINAVGHEVLNTIATDLHSIWEDIKNLKDKEVNGQIVLNITTGGGGNEGEMATGNVIGNGAFAAGSRQVLMGELGPELYVTGGRYYVAGQGGAEFVNLPNDAIVFNHLQTRKLLSTGAAGRGKPVTNEKAATSLATGNAMGLAMATAQQTLATLKQLRAMWQSLANASITDMVGLANMKDTESSSDGGSSKIDRKAWIETLEKWYNWLQKIAELEKEINYEEQLRNTLETRQGPKGKELYESQKRELEMIKQQYAVQKSLVDSRREYFEARRAQLNSSVFGKFYQFDEHGQQFYTRGTKFEFGKTAEYAAAQKAAQANGGNGATTTTITNAAAEMTKHTAEWNKSIGNLALAIYNTRASNQASRLSDGSISYKLNHYETIDKALQMAQTMYRIDENGKATYLGNSTAKGDPLAYSDVSGRSWNIWEQNIGVEFDRLQSGEKQRSNIDQNTLNQSSEYKKLLSQTIQDTAKAVGQEVGGGSSGGAAGANPPRSELAEITQIEGGFAALMELWARDPQTLEPKYTPAEQYAIAQSLGFGNYMLYDQSGNKIEPGENGQDDTFYTSALQALTDNLDADREEMQSLYDSIEEDEKKLLELEQKQNEILLAIRDNQIDVENKILDAIEAREQAIIDELSDTKEVLEDNADKYINGLNEALSNEQRMYQSNKSQNELESLRRQLAILQRSGGSASQINSLQQQIDAKQQENYFDAQQQQIDAIQAASDLEIERLDKQIEIMETTLEFSKEHGLLWAEVSQIMQQDDAVIMDFLLSNTAEYLASSALQQSATYDELLSMVTQWTAYRDDQNKYRPLQEDMEVGLEDIMANIFSTDANVEDSNVISAIIGANAQVTQGMYAVATAATAAASAAAASSGVNTSNSSSQSSGGTNSTSSGTPNRYARDAYLGYDPADNPFYAYNDSMLYSGLYGEGINNIYGNMNNSTAVVNENAVFDSLIEKMAALTGQDEEQVRKDFTFAQGYTHMHASETGTNYWNYLNERDNKYLAEEQDRVKKLQELVTAKGADTPSAYGGTIGEALAKEQERLNQAQEAVDTHASAEKALQTYNDAKVARRNELILEGKTNYQAEQILKEEGYIYSKGGSVPVTGLVSVHGTPQRPEYFLDAEETQMWKHDILGGNSSSLTSRLLALREILNGIESASSHINNSTDNGVIIEKAEVNVDVAQLANDYDARRAGDTIMDEILQIARKTGVSSVRR